MAYYLVSLVEILEQILHHPDHQHNQNCVLDPDKVTQIQSLLEHASFLRDGFAKSERLSQARIESLEDRIKEMVENMEDAITSFQTYKISLPDFKEELRVFESAKQEMTDIINAASQRPTNQRVDYSSRRSDPNPMNMVVGVTEDLNQLRDRLIGKSSSKLEIIPIVGMGGSGKTTLAQILYNEFSCSKSHFDICAWVTISQDYNPRGILQSLLHCVTENPPIDQEIDRLREYVHKSLFGRRYFIVLDDIWSSETWDELRMVFPDNYLGCRIILTTRVNNLADYVDSKSHQMHFLNEDDSWDLLRKKVYGEDSCPRELTEIGKSIAKNCKGLPLALQVIGGLLSQAERSKDSWEQVVSDVNSRIANEDEQFSGIFCLIYDHLPHYLKPCFLYMGAFPEDYCIKASKLIKLWVAEGFLCPVRDKSPEGIAGDYLKLLLDRNLIFEHEKNWVGKVKTYGIHDLLRDLCMKKAKEKKLIWVKNLKDNNLSEESLRMHRVCVHSLPDKYKHVSSSVKLTPLTRSVLCPTIGDHDYISSYLCFDSSLLRVLDVLETDFPTFPKEILQLVNLRYLALYCDSGFPDNISVLRNLQSLIIGGCFISHFTPGIFDIPQLRHLHFHGLRYVKGFEEFDRTSFGVQEKLQSLSTVPLDMLTRLFLGKIPNLRKLGISYSTNILFTYSTDIFDLTCFDKLETLRFYGNPELSKLPNLDFPYSLRKLTLWWCTVPQTFMDKIGMLPNLEALKLQDIAFENLTWEPFEDGFWKLQYLQLLFVDLEDWLADYTHFPVLQHLVIRCCYRLKEIPLEIGDIPTLKIIEVDEDSRMAHASTRRIIEEQRSIGNDLLQIRVCPGFLKNNDVDEEIVKNMKKCAFSFQ